MSTVPDRGMEERRVEELDELKPQCMRSASMEPTLSSIILFPRRDAAELSPQRRRTVLTYPLWPETTLNRLTLVVNHSESDQWAFVFIVPVHIPRRIVAGAP